MSLPARSRRGIPSSSASSGSSSSTSHTSFPRWARAMTTIPLTFQNRLAALPFSLSRDSGRSTSGREPWNPLSSNAVVAASLPTRCTSSSPGRWVSLSGTQPKADATGPTAAPGTTVTQPASPSADSANQR